MNAKCLVPLDIWNDVWCLVTKLWYENPNMVMDIPFTCGMSYWNWSKDYADGVC